MLVLFLLSILSINSEAMRPTVNASHDSSSDDDFPHLVFTFDSADSSASAPSAPSAPASSSAKPKRWYGGYDSSSDDDTLLHPPGASIADDFNPPTAAPIPNPSVASVPGHPGVSIPGHPVTFPGHPVTFPGHPGAFPGHPVTFPGHPGVSIPGHPGVSIPGHPDALSCRSNFQQISDYFCLLRWAGRSPVFAMSKNVDCFWNLERGALNISRLVLNESGNSSGSWEKLSQFYTMLNLLLFDNQPFVFGAVKIGEMQYFIDTVAKNFSEQVDEFDREYTNHYCLFKAAEYAMFGNYNVDRLEFVVQERYAKNKDFNFKNKKDLPACLHEAFEEYKKVGFSKHGILWRHLKSSKEDFFNFIMELAEEQKNVFEFGTIAKLDKKTVPEAKFVDKSRDAYLKRNDIDRTNKNLDEKLRDIRALELDIDRIDKNLDEKWQAIRALQSDIDCIDKNLDEKLRDINKNLDEKLRDIRALQNENRKRRNLLFSLMIGFVSRDTTRLGVNENKLAFLIDRFYNFGNVHMKHCCIVNKNDFKEGKVVSRDSIIRYQDLVCHELNKKANSKVVQKMQELNDDIIAVVECEKKSEDTFQLFGRCGEEVKSYMLHLLQNFREYTTTGCSLYGFCNSSKHELSDFALRLLQKQNNSLPDDKVCCRGMRSNNRSPLVVPSTSVPASTSAPVAYAPLPDAFPAGHPGAAPYSKTLSAAGATLKK